MNAIHESLVDTEGAKIDIETTADVIKPVFSYARKLVKEMKVHIEPDKIRYGVVDPANVTMCGMEIPAEAFDTYDVEETTVGLDLKSTMGALRAGRKRKQDDIRLATGAGRLSTVVQREYSGTQMDLESQIRILDPDSVRQEPDIPDIELGAEATVPRKLFDDVVSQADEYADFLTVKSVGNDLIFSGEGEESGTTAVISGQMESGSKDHLSMLSMDFLKDANKAFRAVGADELTFKFGTELPVRIDYTTELNETEVTGYWFQAPRVHKD